MRITLCELRFIFIIFCGILLTQCRSVPEKKYIPPASLVGEWNLISKKTLPIPYIGHGEARSVYGPADGNKITFYPDSTVDTREIQSTMEHYPIIFAYKSPYRVDNDTLTLFNIESFGWDEAPVPHPAARIKIHGVTNDTLSFKTQTGDLIQYKRAAPLSDTLPTFDAIIVSTSGCFGKCPVTKTMIRSNGSILFFGKYFVDNTGFFTATFDPAAYVDIQDLFRRADIKNIGTNFESKASDLEEITLTFVKNGKIYKSIRDYGEQAPSALMWAYVRLRHLHSFIKLTKLPTDAPLTEHLNLGDFVTATERYHISNSEGFLLWNYLLSGKPSKRSASPRFNLDFSISHSWPIEEFGEPLPLTEIKTDGQLYTFVIKGRESITIDIGFNFFDRNLLSRATHSYAP